MYITKNMVNYMSVLLPQEGGEARFLTPPNSYKTHHQWIFFGSLVYTYKCTIGSSMHNFSSPLCAVLVLSWRPHPPVSLPVCSASAIMGTHHTSLCAGVCNLSAINKHISTWLPRTVSKMNKTSRYHC